MKSLDLFIYQHCGVSAQNPSTTCPIELDPSQYTPEYLIKHILPASCVIISLPSIYFSCYFIDPIGTSPNDYAFPRHTFNKKIFNAIVEDEDATVQRVADMYNDPHLYSPEQIERHIQQSFSGLESREIENKITIPITPFLRNEYRNGRLMHTTNHPCPQIYNFLINEILKSLNLPEDTTILQNDKMRKWGHSYILECVRRHLGGVFVDDKEKYIYTGDSKYFKDFKEYVSWLVASFGKSKCGKVGNEIV
jgi:hypothetical protein